MGIRFDADADQLSLSTGLPADLGALSVSVWFKPVVLISQFTQVPMAFDPSSPTEDLYWQTQTGSSDLGLWTGATFVNSATLVAGTWFWLGLTKNTTTLNSFWASGVGAVSTATITQTITWTPTLFRVGHTRYSGEYTNGVIANLKIWTATLSQAELEAERWRALPVRATNLWAAWPFRSAGDYTDLNGAHTLTSAGTIVTEDGPPVTWGGQVMVMPSLPAGAPSEGAFSAAGVATVNGVGQSIIPTPPPIAGRTRLPHAILAR